jgi:predicted DNA binding protein
VPGRHLVPIEKTDGLFLSPGPDDVSDAFSTFVKDAAKKGWGLEILSVCDYTPGASGIFDLLTPKQKEILLESYRSGFFEHPRKINAGELAEKMGMHKTTLLEHIHKAEKRLIGHILEQVA